MILFRWLNAYETEWIEIGGAFNTNGGCDRCVSLLLYFSFSDTKSLGLLNLSNIARVSSVHCMVRGRLFLGRIIVTW